MLRARVGNLIGAQQRARTGEAGACWACAGLTKSCSMGELDGEANGSAGAPGAVGEGHPGGQPDNETLSGCPPGRVVDMARDTHQEARHRLSALGEPSADDAPTAHALQREALLVARLLTAAARDRRDDGQPSALGADEVGAALSLFEGMREQLDRLETQVVIEARRRGMDWRQIARHQGLNSSQAASQRYQRVMTRLEEIRQGVR